MGNPRRHYAYFLTKLQDTFSIADQFYLNEWRNNKMCSSSRRPLWVSKNCKYCITHAYKCMDIICLHKLQNAQLFFFLTFSPCVFFCWCCGSNAVATPDVMLLYLLVCDGYLVIYGGIHVVQCVKSWNKNNKNIEFRLCCLYMRKKLTKCEQTCVTLLTYFLKVTYQNTA